MQGQEIFEKLNNFVSVKEFCKGVVSIDKIPKLKIKEFVIVNTEPASQPGQHWFCLLKYKQNVYEIFDSLGITEEKETIIKSFIKIKNAKFYFNVTQLQSLETNTCGLFVLYFIVNRLFNFDLKFNFFLNEYFLDNVNTNEQLIEEFSTEFL